MRLFGKTVLAVGLVVLTAAPAWAQQGKGRGGFGLRGGAGGGAMLLNNKGVQKELKVTDEQASKLDTLATELRDKGREDFQKLRDLSPDERREKMREITQTQHAALMKGLTEILKPDQIARFEQIQVQAAGPAAFEMPRVREKLKLTDDQKSKIREIEQDSAGAMREAFQGFQDDREGTMKKIAELRKQTSDKIHAVLTDEQKSTWKELTGAPFEVRFEGGGRRRPAN
jgi:Spy/CpxP family protein refolding chaperone